MGEVHNASKTSEVGCEGIRVHKCFANSVRKIFLFDLLRLTMITLQAGDWSRAEASRGRELGGVEAGARAGLQHSLAHTVATQLAQVTGAARTKVRAVDREKVSSAARSLRTLIKSNWKNSAKSKETSAKSKVNSIPCVFLTMVYENVFRIK